MNPSIFKAYDIRGVYPADVNEEVAREIARACRTLFPSGKVIVGRDVRIGSPELAGALIGELRKNPGCEIVDIGVCSTPLFYFAVNVLAAAGGVMVTASHNPPEWNGFKVVGPGAAMTGGKAVLEAIGKTGVFPEGKGKYEIRDMVPEYAAFLVKQFKIGRPLSVVCDFGNGAVGAFFPAIAERFPGVTFYTINDVTDGKFLSRDPNPLAPGALDGLKYEVVKKNADLGVAFDADGDRAFFVDHGGELIPPHVVALLLSAGETKPVVAEVEIYHLLKSIGYKGGLFESRVGTYFVKRNMKITDAEMGAEYSGHYYFKEFFGADSGIVAFFNVLRSASELPSLGGFLSMVPKRYTAEWKVRIDDPETSLHNISIEYGKRDELERDTTDGIAFISKRWFFGARLSNTEPLLRFFAAANAKSLLDDLVRELMSKIK